MAVWTNSCRGKARHTSAAKLSGEWIQKLHAGRAVVRGIAGGDRQAVDKGRGCDLLIQRILWMRGPQAPPDLSYLRIERQDGVGVFDGDALQPPFQSLGSRSPRNRIVSTPCRYSPIVIAERKTGTSSSFARRKKDLTPAFARSPLRSSLRTSVSNKYTGGPG